VLDLTQSLGAQPFSALEVKPDFAVTATYKWMMGPYSMGFLYVDPKWHEAQPLEHNWMNRVGSENFTALTHYTCHACNAASLFNPDGYYPSYKSYKGNFICNSMMQRRKSCCKKRE